MIAWIGYTIVVTLLLGAAALAAERAARVRRMATRWSWALAMLASLLLPGVISSVSVQVPNLLAPAAANRVIALRDVTSASLAPNRWLAGARLPAPVAATVAAGAAAATAADLDPLLKRAWAAVSAAMLLALAASALLLWVRKRRWPQRTLGGSVVYIAPDAGPAVVGLLRPRIVLPAWLLDAPASRQALVLAHEQAHLDARDPQLLTAALCLLVLMPWNLPLWWQLRRLRHAIEVDCDARVLGAGHELQEYGAALIDIGQRQSGLLVAAAAMAESRSLLEQRIRIMVAAPVRRGGAVALLCAGLAGCLVAAAAQVSPPNAGAGTAVKPAYADAPRRQQVDLPASRLLDYEGVYQLDEFLLMTVTRDGRRLWSAIDGQDKLEQYAEREDEFFSRDVTSQVSFKRNARGQVDSLVIHQGGGDMPAPRLDEASAKAVRAKIVQRSHREGPIAGGEAALRRNLDAIVDGRFYADDMTPYLAQQIERQLPQLTERMRKYGKPRSVQFSRVERVWDVYRVEHEHGVQEYHLLINSDGKVSNAYSREL